ncbi:MAG: hypothetical protein KC501_14635 [Myxococcales bacterium]|nr:hypothetical protein [Myxococcales bacterium]
MHRWLIPLLVLVLGCGAETRDKTTLALEAFQPTKAKLLRIYEALPEQPVAQDCQPRLEGKSPAMIEERYLAAILERGPEPDPTLKKELDLWNTGQLSSLPTQSRLEHMMEDPDVSHAFNIERATGSLESEGYVLVVRTEAYHFGRVEDGRILEKGQWKAWMFVGELETGKIVGVLPIEVTNSDTAYSFDRPGEQSSLHDDLWMNIRGRVPLLTEERCGFALSI